MGSFVTGSPPFGLRLQETKAVCFNRVGAALAVGDVIELDLTQTEAETTNSRVGNSASSLSNVVLPETTSNAVVSIYGVALEVIADNASGLIGFVGHFDVNVDGATAAGGAVGPQDDNARTIIFDADGRPIAIALEADTDNISPCLFDGINGFAVNPAS